MTMHPTDAQLLQFRDGELAADEHVLVGGHLATCTGCAVRLEEMDAQQEWISARLSMLDHRPPDVSASAVVARARRSPRVLRRPLLAASVSLLVLAGAALAAVPGLPFRRYVERLVAAPPVVAPRATAIPAEARLPRQGPGTNGISFVPDSSVEVAFRVAQPSGSIRVSVHDSAAVRLEHYAGTAGYALTATGIGVENAGSRASYSLVLPRTGRVAVRIGTRTVFSRSDGRVTTSARRDSTGAWVLRFAPGK